MAVARANSVNKACFDRGRSPKATKGNAGGTPKSVTEPRAQQRFKMFENWKQCALRIFKD